MNQFVYDVICTHRMGKPGMIERARSMCVDAELQQMRETMRFYNVESCWQSFD